MGLREGIGRWPVIRQLQQGDLLGLGRTSYSPRSEDITARTRDADHVARTICPYCGVGCGQLAYVQDGRITDIEGDPDSPISRGKLCPKGAATFQLVTGAHRTPTVLHRRPGATEWEELDLATAMEMVADRIAQTRERTWQAEDDDGNPLNRTLGFAHIGGATLDNEENYLLKKLYTALGAIQIENQARI